MAETPLVFEIATFAVLAVFFVVDLFIIGRKPHVPSTKECVQHIAFFVVMALIFGGLMWFFAGSKPAIEFYSGWLTEYSLSIDNLFVFVIIMSNFAVPKELQKFVLSVGITVALVLRGLVADGVGLLLGQADDLLVAGEDHRLLLGVGDDGACLLLGAVERLLLLLDDAARVGELLREHAANLVQDLVDVLGVDDLLLAAAG